MVFLTEVLAVSHIELISMNEQEVKVFANKVIIVSVSASDDHLTNEALLHKQAYGRL